MRASCPSCDCSVWVAEEEVMGQTVEIKCPSCKHVFIVRSSPRSVAGRAGHQISVSESSARDLKAVDGEADDTRGSRSGIESSLTEAEKKYVLNANKSKNGFQAQPYVKQRTGLSAIRAQSGLRTQDEDAQSPIQPAILTEPEEDNLDAVRANRRSLHAWSFLAGMSALALVVMIFVTLMRYELIDGATWLFPERDEHENIVKDAQIWSESEAYAVDSSNTEEIYKRAMDAAEQAMHAKRYSRAALEFNRALSVQPGSSEALRGLEKAYRGLGDLERAALLGAQNPE